MKKDRVELESLLIEVIDQVKHNRKIVQQINNVFREYGLPSGTFQSISRSKNEVYLLDVARLFVLTHALHITTNNNAISPFEYFTIKEIDQAKGYIKKTKSNNVLELPIILDNVIKMSDEEYVTKIDASTLVQMYLSQLIFYDFETQRSPKFKKHGNNSFIEVPEINKRSVDDISQHMLNGIYLPDTITLNVYSEQVESISYAPKTQILTINEEAIISILDGFHRLQGAVKAFSVNPELTQQMFLSIRCYDKDTAKRFFGQINTVNIVKPERLKELKSEKYSDKIVKDLQRKSELTGKIASASKVSKIAGQLTTFDTLSYAIEKVFNPTNFIEEREIAQYLTDFFGYLIAYYVDEFKDTKTTYINHPKMFAGYIQIAKIFKNENISLNKLRQYVDEIDFNDSELIEALEERRTNKSRNMTITYFENRGELNV
ncbi:DNA sulfur modification protein DndB [Paenibacillus sp. FSL R10-2788]|uniref:DNA sulfur modification protein DndB n=1 Tax=Paenibacillus sp. FSL R10-2788 TaxID=2954694 RepID=UPI0030F76173